MGAICGGSGKHVRRRGNHVWWYPWHCSRASNLRLTDLALGINERGVPGVDRTEGVDTIRGVETTDTLEVQAH